MNTLRAQLIFPYKPNFWIFFEFPATKSTEKSISSTPWLWTCEINFVKSDSPRTFLEHQERPQISIQFSFSILFRFNWENSSIINGFHNHSFKQSQTKLLHPYPARAFHRYQECDMKQSGLGAVSVANKTKQTTLLHRWISYVHTKLHVKNIPIMLLKCFRLCDCN